MKTKRPAKSILISRAFIGWVIFALSLLLFLNHLMSAVAFALLLAPGLGMYLWGCLPLIKTQGRAGIVALLMAISGLMLTPLALLAWSNKKQISRNRDDEPTAVWDNELTGIPKRIVGWLIGLFLISIGAACIVGYEIYWERYVIPERQGMATAVSIAPDKLDPQNDGKLVHVSGMLGGAEKLVDAEFGVAADGLLLRRRVWMRQWEQSRLPTSRSRTGIEDMTTHKVTTLTTSTTYDYSQVWSEGVVDSKSFHDGGHDNPATKKIPDRTVAAANISLGVFAVTPKLSGLINNYQSVPLNDKNIATLAAPLRAEAKLVGDEIYFGNAPNNPAIGDLKVKYVVAPATTASVIARQDGTNLTPYPVGKGEIAQLQIGYHSASEMTAQFSHRESQERRLVWGAGIFLFFVGCLTIFIVRK